MDMQELQFYSMLVKCRLLARQSRAGNLNIKRIIANLLLLFNSVLLQIAIAFCFTHYCLFHLHISFTFII